MATRDPPAHRSQGNLGKEQGLQHGILWNLEGHKNLWPPTLPMPRASGPEDLPFTHKSARAKKNLQPVFPLTNPATAPITPLKDLSFPPINPKTQTRPNSQLHHLAALQPRISNLVLQSLGLFFGKTGIIMPPLENCGGESLKEAIMLNAQS